MSLLYGLEEHVMISILLSVAPSDVYFCNSSILHIISQILTFIAEIPMNKVFLVIRDTSLTQVKNII